MSKYWSISVTEAGLLKGYFKARGIPLPDVADYRSYSERVPRSDGGLALHGYANLSLQWRKLTPGQANRIRTIAQDAIDNYSGVLFMTIDRNNAEGAGADWIDVSGKVHMPIFESSDPTYGRGVRGFEGVQLFVNNLTIVNEPSAGL